MTDKYGGSIEIDCLWWHLIEPKNRLSQLAKVDRCQNWTNRRDIRYNDVDLRWTTIYFSLFASFIAFFMLPLDSVGNFYFAHLIPMPIEIALLHFTVALFFSSVAEPLQNILLLYFGFFTFSSPSESDHLLFYSIFPDVRWVDWQVLLPWSIFSRHFHWWWWSFDWPWCCFSARFRINSEKQSLLFWSDQYCYKNWPLFL